MVGIAQNMITANKSIHYIKQGEITLCGKETSILNDQDRQLWAALTGIIFTQPPGNLSQHFNTSINGIQG